MDRIGPLNLDSIGCRSDRTLRNAFVPLRGGFQKVLTRIRKKSSGKPRLSDNLSQETAVSVISKTPQKY